MRVLFLVMMLLLCSCASYTPGEEGSLVESNSKETLQVTGEIDENIRRE